MASIHHGEYPARHPAPASQQILADSSKYIPYTLGAGARQFGTAHTHGQDCSSQSVRSVAITESYPPHARVGIY
jgi:hypothetical protein